jgi:hypothetical protein
MCLSDSSNTSLVNFNIWETIAKRVYEVGQVYLQYSIGSRASVPTVQYRK